MVQLKADRKEGERQVGVEPGPLQSEPFVHGAHDLAGELLGWP